MSNSNLTVHDGMVSTLINKLEKYAKWLNEELNCHHPQPDQSPSSRGSSLRNS